MVGGMRAKYGRKEEMSLQDYSKDEQKGKDKGGIDTHYNPSRGLIPPPPPHYPLPFPLKEHHSCFIYINDRTEIRGYPQRIRLHQRLYGICLVHFLVFRALCRPKLAYFCAYSFNKPSKYSIECRNN